MFYITVPLLHIRWNTIQSTGITLSWIREVTLYFQYQIIYLFVTFVKIEHDEFPRIMIYCLKSDFYRKKHLSSVS